MTTVTEFENYLFKILKACKRLFEQKKTDLQYVNKKKHIYNFYMMNNTLK